MQDFKKGYIYIFTNPSFPNYVKIGYADDVFQRLHQLNRSESTPFAFRCYATYEVGKRLTDMKLHSIIDKLNPELRAIDTVDGKKRVREFYAMTAEEAYEILEAIAEINGLEDNLKKMALSEKEKKDEDDAKKVRLESFTFSMCNIHEGEEIQFINDPSLKIVVSGNKKVIFKDEEYSLSALARKLLDCPYRIAGPRYFTYKGKLLCDLREEINE